MRAEAPYLSSMLRQPRAFGIFAASGQHASMIDVSVSLHTCWYGWGLHRTGIEYAPTGRGTRRISGLRNAGRQLSGSGGNGVKSKTGSHWRFSCRPSFSVANCIHKVAYITRSRASHTCPSTSLNTLLEISLYLSAITMGRDNNQPTVRCHHKICVREQCLISNTQAVYRTRYYFLD